MKLLKICRKVRNFRVDIQMSKLTRKLNEIQRELEERQNISKAGFENFDKVVLYGPDKLPKNPLDDIDNDKLVGDI